MLKALAFHHIHRGLGKCDIVEESFSRFASRYVRYITTVDYVLMGGGGGRHDQIRDLYVTQLASVWLGDSTETTRASFDGKIDSFAEGELEHAAEMLSTLWEVVKKPGGITVPSNPPPAGSVPNFFTRSVPASPSLPLHGSAHSTPQGLSRSHGSRKLGSCKDRPDQVDPRRRFLRPEVLG